MRGTAADRQRETFKSHSSVSDHPFPTHLDVRGVDVTRVVFFVGDKLDSILLVRDDITKTVALQVFGQSCRRDDAVRPLLRHLLVLSEDPLLLQLQLQGLTLGCKWKKKRG